MGFAQGTTAANTETNASTDWKAQAFLNLYVKRADGSKMKIGAIALKESKKMEAALIARLQQDDGMAAFKAGLEVEFNLVDNGKPAVLGF